MAGCSPAEQVEALGVALRQTSPQHDIEVKALQDLVSAPAGDDAAISAKLVHVLQLGLAHSDLLARKEAVLLWTTWIEQLPRGVDNDLRGLLPGVLLVVQQLENNQVVLKDLLLALSRVAEVNGAVFQAHLEQVTMLMVTLAQAKAYMSDDIRQTAFEFLVSLAEKKSKMCTRQDGFVPQAVQLCMEFMLEVTDEADWENRSVSWSMTHSPNYDIGEENIDRLAKALGAATVLPLAFALVGKFMHGTCWKQRFAAIMTLSQCAESVEEETHVDEIVKKLVSMVQDEHPRVRYAVLHALGQTASDQAPYVQETHHELVMPALLTAMDDPDLRVASHACAAFTNFAEEFQLSALLPYVPQLMAKLAGKMISTHRPLAEQAVTAVAVIAGTSQMHFVPYYGELMPVLKQIVLVATQTKENSMLQGKAFECISLLGMAVGKDVFHQDALETMHAMMEIASQGVEEGDPTRKYMQEAAERICRTLQHDFMPYLSHLLPGICATLQTQPQEVVDPDAEDESEVTLHYQEDGVVMGLRTAQIEDIKGAVQLLGCFLEVLGQSLAEHLRPIAAALLPLLSFQFCDDVKREAIQAWQEVLKVARLCGDSVQPQESLRGELLSAFLKATLPAMQAEEDVEIMQAQAQGAIACLRAAGPKALAGAHVQELAAQVRTLIEESTQRLWDVMGQTVEGDEDDQAEAEQYKDADLALRNTLAELAGTIMEVYKEEIVQCGGLQHFLKVIEDCLQEDCSSYDRCLALYLVGDMLEKLGVQVVHLWPTLMPPVFSSIKDDDAWVRQAACLGAMHAAKEGSFADYAGATASALQEVVTHPAAKQPSHIDATEAALAAIGVLCRFHGARLPYVANLLAVWVEALPMQVDMERAAQTHELLMQFTREGVPALQERLGSVCRVFLEVYETATTSQALNESIRTFLVELGEERLSLVNPPLGEMQRKHAREIMLGARGMS